MNSLHVKYLINSGDGRIGQRGIDKFCPLCLGEGVISLGPLVPTGMLFLPHLPPQDSSAMFRDVLFRNFFFLFLQLGCVEGWGGVLLVLETMCAPTHPHPRPAQARQRLIWPKMSLVPRLRNTNPGLGDFVQ